MAVRNIDRRKEIDIELLRCIFKLKDGIVIWKQCRLSNYNGKPAGYVSKNGYIDVNCRGTRYYVHRIAFALHNGFWPKGIIDHIDGDRANNNPNNLCDCLDYENMQNIKPRPNKSGITGVYAYTGGWQGEFCYNKVRYRKWFKSKKAAIKFVIEKRKEFGVFR